MLIEPYCLRRRSLDANFYVYGPSYISVEQINTTTEKAQYLHHDQAGSTQFIAGETGTTEAAYSYTPYGATEEHTGTTTTPFGYDGQYTSSDTGLIYLRARVYDPSTAQFLTVDPLEATTDAPYTYAGDNPVNGTDPTGLLESAQSPGEFGIPCIYPFCAPPPPVVEALEHGFEKVKESIISTITESNGDEGEAELKAKEAERDEQACAQTPPGYDPETWTKGPASRPSDPGENFYDPEGGEWRWHAPDKYHPEAHWDYKAPGKNTPWINVDP